MNTLAPAKPCACDEAAPFLFGPTPKALKPAEAVLIRLGYTPWIRRAILGELARDGTAQCTSTLAEAHRDEVERALPGPNAWDWPSNAETDAVFYELAEDRR